MTSPTPDPHEIAGKLTEAQREGLLRQPCRSWWGDEPATMPHKEATADALARRGLCLRMSGVSRSSSHVRPLTPLGLQVRAILQEQANG